jgi:KipI family sensor histidine kinase inhibitor
MLVQPASDQSLLVTFGNRISIPVHRRVAALMRALQAAAIPGIRNLHPAYCSLLIEFDSLILDHDSVEAQVRTLIDRSHEPAPPSRTIDIPVTYDGPDLEDVARHCNLTTDDVIEMHSSVLYTVYFLGFVPGFAYLGDLPEALVTPRLKTPRKHVPAGSVAIGGRQTAIYPLATPGGWRLIGRTSLNLSDLLQITDQVRFIPRRAGTHATGPSCP